MSGVGKVAAETFEAQIVRLEAEREARLTVDEARTRLLDAIAEARQGCVRPNGWSGDLIKGVSETEMVKEGVQVIALADFNAALDRAFPAPAHTEEKGEGRASR